MKKPAKSFNVITIGELMYAPHAKIVASLVSHQVYGNTDYNLDFRKHYGSRTKKWYLTKSGLVMSRDNALAVQNALSSIPEDVDMTEKKYVECSRIKKHEYCDICVGIGFYHSTYGVDVREHVDDVNRGYKGFSIRGFRIPIDHVEELANLFLAAVQAFDNKMVQKYRNKPTGAKRGRPRKSTL